MIDGSEKRNRQLAFELQNSHVCEKRSKNPNWRLVIYKCGQGFKLGTTVKPCFTDPCLIRRPA